MSNTSNLIYGIHAVTEAIRSGRHLERVFLHKNLKGATVNALIREVQQSKTPFSKVPAERIRAITKKNHQGVVAFVSPVQYHSLLHLAPALYEDGKIPLLVILNGITDVRNFGAIVRTAECLGAHGVVIPVKGGAQINEDSIRTSSGALNHMPICRENLLTSAVAYLQDCGIKVVACSEKASQAVWEADLTVPLAMIMGSEESGIATEMTELADETVKIPMSGKIASLNASAAAAMALYEVQRQRS